MIRWEDDNVYVPHLDAAAAQRVVSALLPDFGGESWSRPAVVREFDTWVVDDTWIVRIARRAADADGLERERLLLDGLTLPVAVPRIAHWAPGVAIHRMVPGVAAEPVPAERLWPPLADQLAELLSVLHATPPEVAQRAGLETCQRPGRTVVSYSDFKREHVLLSDDRASVAGVIDWADVQLCPPERDFAGLVASFGPRFAALVADSYDGTVNLQAAIDDARAWAMQSLADAEAGKKDWPLESGWSDEDHARGIAARIELFREAVRTVFAD